MVDKLKFAGLALALTFSTAAIAADCCKDMACCKEGADCCDNGKAKKDAPSQHAGDHAIHA